jgi:hypothetical protein
MGIFLGCLLIVVVLSVYLYEVGRRFKDASDDDIVPDRWDGLPREVDPKFYWFQVARMIIVIVVCVIAIIACIVCGVLGLRG